MIQVAEIDYDYKTLRLIIKERVYDQIGDLVLSKDLLNNLITEKLMREAIDSLDEQAQKIVLYGFRTKPLDVSEELEIDSKTVMRIGNEAEDNIFRFIFSKISSEIKW